jgi:predicted nucleic acid-binding protein
LFDRLTPTIELAERATAVAIELRHPAYDCFYLALGERERTVLITADRTFLRKLQGKPYSRLVRLLVESDP